MRSSTGAESFALPGAEPDLRRVAALIARETATFVEMNRQSERTFAEAKKVLAGGVVSSFHAQQPFPIYLESAVEGQVVDVDGNERLDFHNGFGAMLQGHAHPILSRVIRDSAHLGTHAGATGRDAVAVARELSGRWGMPLWRFATTGSEATMDALRLARAVTGRDTVVKMAGAYHGHHDAVLVSVEAGDGEDTGSPPLVPAGLGIPEAVVRNTAVVAFNDADELAGRLAELRHGGRPAACVIVEPVFQMGVLVPEPGYLADVRQICDAEGALLVFDEVKSGFAVGPGGWTGSSEVRPDVVTVGKALGGGLPVSAVGGTHEAMSFVSDGQVFQAGTFNGNALAMRVARHNLTEVLTEESSRVLARRAERLFREGCQAVLHSGSAGHAAWAGARGFFALSATPALDHRGVAAAHRADVGRLAWLYFMNRGLYVTPARPLQWTVSLGHDSAAITAYVSVLAALVEELAAGS